MADYAKTSKTTTSTVDFEKIKKRTMEIESAHNEKLRLFERYREIYFMTNAETPKNAAVDKGDWKITVSPSGRNEVTGMKRLMDTGEIHITVKSAGETVANSDELEQGLKTILRVSGEAKRARVEKDANLSAVLWGPVCLRAESLDDLIATQKKPAYKKRLENMRRRTPFIISCLNAEESFPDWGEFGMLAHVGKYKMRGAELKERWAVADCQDNREYIVHDYVDLENRVVWADGINTPLFSGPHNLPDLNIAVRYAGGSSLFYKPEEQLQSFLYAKAMGDLDRRENLILTYIFTSVFMQGLPGRTMLVQNSESTQPTVDIDYASGVKRIVVTGAKADMVDMQVIDGDVMQIKAMLDDMSGDSTIRGQTLGENISGATFSALAMLSSAGKLPMIDPQEAVEQAFSDIFLHILTRIRDEGMENDVIQPADIPDDVEVEVSMEAKLPQDNLRNAQVAGMLGDKVSDEWIHTNLLQIGNTEDMHAQIFKEQIKKAMIGKLAQDPQYIDQFLQAAMGMQKPQPQPQGQPGQPPTAPPGMEEMMQGQNGMPPQPPQQGAPTPEQMAMMMQQGGGMEGMPQGGPMIPPEERM